MFAVECPNCFRVAIEDYYCNSGEKYIYCLRCGYNYSKTIIKTIINETIDNVEYKEERMNGYGVFLLVKRDGARKLTLLNSEPTFEEREMYKREYLENDVDQENSYLVTFKDGIFTNHLGNPEQKFYLSFEDHKKNMGQKYTDLDDLLVPIE